MHAILLGGAQTDFAVNWSKGADPLSAVLCDVVPRALESAEVSSAHLDATKRAGRLGTFVGNFDAHQYLRQGHIGAFLSEVGPAFVDVPGARYEAACASGSVALDAAATKIRAGEIDLALVVGVEIMRTVSSEQSNDYLATAAHYQEEAAGVDYFFPKLFGKLTERLIELSGLGEERLLACLREISRTNFCAGRDNPNAQTRNWETEGEAFAEKARAYADRLGGTTRLSDCAQLTDGAAAILLASPNWLREHRGRRAPISRLRGHGHRVGPIRFEDKLRGVSKMEDLLPWTRSAVQAAYQSAEVKADDIDVVELHDCFTASEYAMLPLWGWCAPDQAHALIESGDLSKGGKHPVNPSGGLIGGGHPVGATGVRMALDIHRQVTGQAGDTQVDNARIGATLNIGGTFTTNMCFVIDRPDSP